MLRKQTESKENVTEIVNYWLKYGVEQDMNMIFPMIMTARHLAALLGTGHRLLTALLIEQKPEPTFVHLKLAHLRDEVTDLKDIQISKLMPVLSQ